MAKSRTHFIKGGAGQIEVLIDEPVNIAPVDTPPKGLALIAHPHPLYGGTNENKVVQTMARTFVQLGYEVWRPNFRGVGQSAGQFDEGKGEAEDLMVVLTAAMAELHAKGISAPPVLAGFSFGAFVQTLVAQTLERQAMALERLVLVGPATTRFAVQPVRGDTIVIHGEKDEVVPLVNVFEWARTQSLPITVVPDADHFFNRKLVTLKQIILSAWGIRSED
jgi:uncharacterized protein